MASESGEYEEDWEAAELSVGKKGVVSIIDGHEFPLENDECRDAEPTQEEHEILTNNKSGGVPEDTTKTFYEDVKDSGLKATVGKIADIDHFVKAEDVSISEGTQSSIEDEHVIIPDEKVSREDQSDLVRIHGHHYKPAPPPVPVGISATSKAITEAKSQPRPDIGALQARVAAKRIAEFRRRQECKAEQERALESEWSQKRREIRRSNDVMHKALGIAGLTAQDHLRIAHRRHKQEIKEKEMAASQERRNRWYNNIPKRPARAPEHIRELQVQHLREKHEWEKKMQLAQKTIRANQLVLRQETQAIIANASGTYVRGSYLLKVANDTTKTQRQPPPNDQMIIAAQ